MIKRPISTIGFTHYYGPHLLLFKLRLKEINICSYLSGLTYSVFRIRKLKFEVHDFCCI